ncbi:MAG: DMT family transporter [Gaiellaceae bacterium]
MATWPYYLFAIAAGAMLPIQFGINAQLAGWVGSPLRATLVSFVVGRGGAARGDADLRARDRR